MVKEGNSLKRKSQKETTKDENPVFEKDNVDVSIEYTDLKFLFTFVVIMYSLFGSVFSF